MKHGSGSATLRPTTARGLGLLLAIVITAVAIMTPAAALALTSGPKNAGTGTASGTGTAWSSASNITSPTGSPYVTCAVPGNSSSNYLYATNYGFSIPAGAVIDGITLVVNRQNSGSSSSLYDQTLSLTKTGSAVVGSDLSTGTAWGSSFTAVTYGGSSNLWGTTWTPAEINASTFGAALQVNDTTFSSRTANVDYMQITVTYHMDTVPPVTASVTSPASGSTFRATSAPTSFGGSCADDSNGVGLNANSTTITLTNSSGQYWNGLSWVAGPFSLATTHSATTGGTAASWTYSTMPTWATSLDGTYTIQATANDIAGNAYTGTASTFVLDDGVPTASVTAPVTGTHYNSATAPTSFGGSVSDNAGGVGLSANSTTFTLRRASDNYYWTGTTWQASAANLATTHGATTGGTAATWANSGALPVWSTAQATTYTVVATATDKVGNTGTATSTFVLDDLVPPATASVTAPANGSAYRTATMPASFSGSASDNSTGTGLPANSVTITLQGPDGQYWTGSGWQASPVALSTTHSATTLGNSATWTRSAGMPTWSAATDGTYTVQATATDNSGNSFTGSAVSFALDNSAPNGTITSPADTTHYNSATAPSAFAGTAGDSAGGVGLSANSTTFTLRRASDNYYWTGTTWQASAANLATTHGAVAGGSSTTWANSSALPAWSTAQATTYTVVATMTDRAGNTAAATSSFVLDDLVPPATASVTAPANGSAYRTATMPASFSGSASDNSTGTGLPANSVTITLQGPDGQYWTGSGWQASPVALSTTHSATTLGNSATWTRSAGMPTWSAATDGTYTVQATATDNSGNSFTGSAVSFALDNSAPSATITNPGEAHYISSQMPDSFVGSIGDPASGTGVTANSTTFTLRRASDNYYWTGTTWQASAANLATTHGAVAGGSSTTWTSSSALPDWDAQPSGGYTVTVTGTDKAGNTTVSSILFYLDDTPCPSTATGTFTRQLSGNYFIYTFTSGAATFTPSVALNADVLVVGGGGGGGGTPSTVSSYYGGGGGAGGFTTATVQVSAPAAVVIGAGGAGNSGASGSTGGASSFGALTAGGGGAGGLSGSNGGNGGSGGGGGRSGSNGSGGSATGSGVGNSGAAAASGHGGGGGGAGAVGGSPNGGAGLQASSVGTSTYFAGGGGGGGSGTGGSGIGGAGASNGSGNAASANTGSGGGGGANTSYSSARTGGAGGSGIVIVRYAIPTYTITASPGPNGSISPSGGTGYQYGESATYTVSPNAGYHISGIKVDGVAQAVTSTVTFANVSADHTISASFSPDHVTITPSCSANGTISPSTPQYVLWSDTTTFTMTPDPGYHVSEVDVNGSSIGSTPTAYGFSNVDGDQTIYAAFAINQYRISSSAGAHGTITASQTVPYGGQATFTATPDTGYHILDLSVDGVSQGATGTYTFTSVAAPHTISATFAINTYTVTPSAGANGSISPSGIQTVNWSDSATFTITADPHYHITNVIKDGTSIGTSSTVVFSNVAENHTLSATFAIDQFTVAPVNMDGQHGTWSPATTLTVDYGTPVSVSATPDAHYGWGWLSIDSGPWLGQLQPGNAYGLGPVTQNRTFSFRFDPMVYHITAGADSNGSISPSGSVAVTYPNDQTFTIAPNNGYHVNDVLLNGSTSLGATSSVTLHSPGADGSIYASFAINRYHLAYQAGDHGSLSGATSQTVDWMTSGSAVTAIADYGYHFVNWSDGNPSQIRTDANVVADHDVTANFAINHYTIHASAGAHGSISPSGDIDVTHGSDHSFDITPDDGWSIDDVVVDDSSIGPSSTVLFPAVSQDHTITASFNDVTKPTAGITSPAASTTLAGTHAIISGYAADAGSGVSMAFVRIQRASDGYWWDAETGAWVSSAVDNLASGTTSWSYDWTFDPASQNGTETYSISAKSLDNSGNWSDVSTAVGGIHIDNTGPATSISAPSDDATFTASGTTISGTADDGPAGTVDHVTLHISRMTSPRYWDGSAWGDVPVDILASGTTNWSYDWSFDPASQDGTESYLVTAASTDVMGNTGSEASASDLHVDNTAPQVAITSPSTEQTLTGSSATIGFTTTDGTGVITTASVSIERNDGKFWDGSAWSDTQTWLGVEGDGSHWTYAWDFDPASQNGTASYTVRARATDPAGNVGDATDVTGVRIDNTEPDVAITAPTSGQTLTNYSASISGTADDHEGIVTTESITIQRADGQYWDGSSWTGTETWLGVSDADAGQAGTHHWTYEWTYAPANQDGSPSYSIVARADDVMANTGTSAATSDVKIDNIYKITTSATSGGTLDPNTSPDVNRNDSKTFTITPDAHYHIVDVTRDGSSLGDTRSVTFENVIADHTLTATFTIDTYTITSDHGAHGTISGSQVVDWNADSAAFSITPDTGYQIDKVYVDGVSIGASSSVTFPNVVANHLITATFAIDNFTITPTAHGHGAISPASPVMVSTGGGYAFTFTPDTGYHVAEVDANGSAVVPTPTAGYTFLDVEHDSTLDVTFAQNNYTISSSAGANGSISGDQTVAHGSDSASFTITPAPGYHVSDVSVDASSVGTPTSYKFTNVTSNHTIHAEFSLDQFTLTSSAGTHGAISASQVVDRGSDSAPFSITPDVGYHIADVSVDASSVGAPSSYTFTGVTANHAIAATFAINTYTLSSIAGDHGSISGTQTVAYGSDSAPFAITPDTGYHIDQVYVDGVPFGPLASYQFTNIAGNHFIVATFAIDTHTITPSASAGGSISPSTPQTVNYGSGKRFDFAPDTGYHIADVSIDASSVGTPASYTFSNVTGDHTVHVDYALNGYNLTSSAGAHGSISASQVVAYGSDSASFTITPDTGYHIAEVDVDGAPLGSTPASYKFTNVTQSHTISATFAIDQFTISAGAGSNGSVSPAGTQTVDYGSSHTFTVAADPHYHIVSVLKDSVSIGASSSVTFANVTGNHTLSATFAIDQFTLTPSAGSGGAISPSTTQTVGYGASQHFDFTPSDGQHVSGVLVDSVSIGTTPTSYDFTGVSASHTIHVDFAVNRYALNASASGGGSISASQVVDWGTDSAAFTFTPDAGHHLVQVLVDGVSQGQPASYTFHNVTGDHTISAVFASDQFTVAPAPGAHGAISPAGTQTVDWGSDSPLFTITPDTGYYIANVSVDASSVGTPSSYTLTNVRANHTIAASFAIDTFQIASIAGANGTISGTQTVNFGSDSAPFAITPATGYHVDQVFVDGVPMGALPSYTFTNVTGNHFIVASFAIDTHTITPSASTGGSISPSTVQTVDYGGGKRFDFTPNTGYHVADVSVDASSVGTPASYSLTDVTADRAIHVDFALNTYALTSSAGAHGSISGSQSVAHGSDSASFTITPDTGYHIAEVDIDGTPLGSTPASYKFTNVTGPHTISATFAADSLSIGTSSGPGGSVSAPQSVLYGGDSDPFTITPDTGYHVADVVADGESVGAVTSYTFHSVTHDTTISASFALNTYALTSSAGAHGSISGSQNVAYGSDSASFTITPDSGYRIADVIVDNVSVGAVDSYQFTNVTATHTISATFASNSYNTFQIVPSANGGGSISPSNTQVVSGGSEPMFSFTPAEGHHVAEVDVDGTDIGSAPSSYLFSPVSAGHTIAVTFAINTYTITPSAGANGSITASCGPTTDWGSDSATYTITPNPGYHVSNVVIDGVSVGAVTTYKFPTVTANHTISVTFARTVFGSSASLPRVSGALKHTTTLTFSGSISPSHTAVVVVQFYQYSSKKWKLKKTARVTAAPGWTYKSKLAKGKWRIRAQSQWASATEGDYLTSVWTGYKSITVK